MPRQLPSECLSEIFECLENDALRSCSLVSRFWCKVSVPILWTSIQNYNTLIACLPNESKEILYKNEITIITPTSKPPLFNYVAFIKSLSTEKVIKMILSIVSQILDYNKEIIVMQEIFKMFMNRISLKTLVFCFESTLDFCSNSNFIQIIPFTTYPGAIDCLRNLSELNCDSDISSEFFYQLSQTCHHIQSLIIIRDKDRGVSNGLSDLISVQRNLKYLCIYNDEPDYEVFTEIVSSLTKLPNTLTELDIGCIPLSFIVKFTNLQTLLLKFGNNIEDFKVLHDITFSQLRILKFHRKCPKYEHFIKFLENNGKNLKELYINDDDLNSLNLAIAKLCPNLKSLRTQFKVDEVETLKIICNCCQQLESIEVFYDFNYLNGSKTLEVITKYSPKKFCKLTIYYKQGLKLTLFPEELEPVFINWANRIPRKSLSLSIIKHFRTWYLGVDMEVIEKFKKLGVIKKFEIITMRDWALTVGCWLDRYLI